MVVMGRLVPHIAQFFTLFVLLFYLNKQEEVYCKRDFLSQGPWTGSKVLPYLSGEGRKMRD